MLTEGDQQEAGQYTDPSISSLMTNFEVGAFAKVGKAPLYANSTMDVVHSHLEKLVSSVYHYINA